MQNGKTETRSSEYRTSLLDLLGTLQGTRIDLASKEDLAETARILALQAAHYARKYGELPIPDLTHLLGSTADEESVALLRDGTIALVGILGIVKGVGGVDIDEPVH